MASTIKIFLISILYTLTATTMANCQQEPLTGSWEEFPHGIAVCVTLNGSLLTAYAKNTLSSPMRIVGDTRHLVRFFYLDLNNNKVPLTDKSDVNAITAGKVSGSAIIPQGDAAPFHLQIELNPDELAAIKGRPMACRFFVLDLTTKQYIKIESTPKMLSIGP